jgi:putative glutathione S-transferase
MRNKSITASSNAPMFILLCGWIGALTTHPTPTQAFLMVPLMPPRSLILRSATATATATATPTCLFSSNDNNNNGNSNNVDRGFNLLGIASQVVPQGRIVQTAKAGWRFLWTRFMVELAPQDKSGSYQRPSYTCDSTLGSNQYPIEQEDSSNSGGPRYHVYVGNPCPWCHRVKLVVNILGLSDDGMLGMTQLVDDPVKASRGGWIFGTPPPQAPELKDLRELYQLCRPGYEGRCTAPVLVDWKTRTIVSNESKDIVRMLPLLLEGKKSQDDDDAKQSSASSSSTPMIDLCPANLQSQIDETNDWIYQLINNGCYQCGFATTQSAYDRASANVLQGLDRAEAILKEQNFLCGDTQFTESDVFLLPTMLRFDAVYAPLFGAGGSRHWRLQCDYPSIFQWMKRCWKEIPGVSTSIDLEDASRSYYQQLFPLNPGGIVPSTVMTAKRLGLEE